MKEIKQKIGIFILGIFVLFAPMFSFADYATDQAGLTPASDLGGGISLTPPPSSQIDQTGITLQNTATVPATQNSLYNTPSPSQTDSLGYTTVAPASNQNPTVQSASQSSFSLVPNCTTVNPRGGFECGWSDLVTLAKNLMVYLIFIGTTLAAISVAYAGFMYATSSGNSGKIEKAHHIFTSVAIGVLFLWGGWLLVATVMKTLGVKDAYSLVSNSSVKPITPTNSN